MLPGIEFLKTAIRISLVCILASSPGKSEINEEYQNILAAGFIMVFII